MKNSPEIIAAIQAKYPENGAPCSVYRVAKLLKAEQTLVYNVTAGRRSLPRSLLVKAAELLDCEPGALVAITVAEREKNAKLRASLLRIGNAAMASAIAGALVVPNCILCKIPRAYPSAKSPHPGGFTVQTFNAHFATALS